MLGVVSIGEDSFAWEKQSFWLRLLSPEFLGFPEGFSRYPKCP